MHVTSSDHLPFQVIDYTELVPRAEASLSENLNNERNLTLEITIKAACYPLPPIPAKLIHLKIT